LQNLFLPSMKLIEKVRVDSKLKRHYDKPLIPLERLLAGPQADSAKLQELKKLRETIDPFKLAKTIEQNSSVPTNSLTSVLAQALKSHCQPLNP
jgi:hypothetical protein